MRTQFIFYAIVSLVVISIVALFWQAIVWILLLVIPAIVIGLNDSWQTKHTLRRNFPLVGRLRWIMEWMRPFFRQYIIESDTDGAPINRMFRSIIYQRAKGELDTVPYGTKVDTYRVGYEWCAHSMAAIHLQNSYPDPRVVVGGLACKQPYSASLLNISAMSFGALSDNAIRALNKGAKKGGFAHNTGEGSVSPYHLENGGDLIWQVGTGYFGCRNHAGNFCETTFEKVACHPNVKMIEIKLSQGAKPGHGGILPAEKNTPEIARIRAVEVNTCIASPPTHSAFSTPIEMMHFIQKLRDLSDGKPIGFKLSIGRRSEFLALCKAMIKTGIRPDFITVDGGEGGTGAAPLEYCNSIGMPLRDALAFVCDCLIGYDLKKEIRVIASGKILTGFHIVKNLSLGADLCNSARGMMIALGCVQSLVCNNNKCPTGITTQNRGLADGLNVTDKSERVARFHGETIKAVMEISSSAGLTSPTQFNRTHIFRRISKSEIKRYDEVFSYLKSGSFLKPPYSDRFEQEMKEASAESFQSSNCIALHDEGFQNVVLGGN